MTSFAKFLLVAGIAIGTATAIPASATVLTTSPVWTDSYSTAGTYTQCNVVNASTTPLSSTSKVELLDTNGTVLSTQSLAGLPPGAVSDAVDYGSFGFRLCRFTVSGAKKIRGMVTVYFFDGTRYITIAQADAR